MTTTTRFAVALLCLSLAGAQVCFGQQRIRLFVDASAFHEDDQQQVVDFVEDYLEAEYLGKYWVTRDPRRARHRLVVDIETPYTETGRKKVKIDPSPSIDGQLRTASVGARIASGVLGAFGAYDAAYGAREIAYEVDDVRDEVHLPVETFYRCDGKVTLVVTLDDFEPVSRTDTGSLWFNDKGDTVPVKVEFTRPKRRPYMPSIKVGAQLYFELASLGHRLDALQF